MNERLREELKSMAAEDRRVRRELLGTENWATAMRHEWWICVAKMPLA
jgi:hypothetical protein